MEKAFKKRFVILVLPTLIAFIIAFIIPFIQGIYLSFTKFTTVTDAQWIGLSNYILDLREKIPHAPGYLMYICIGNLGRLT